MGFYVSSSLLAQATIGPGCSNRLDVAVLDILRVDFFDPQFSNFPLLNPYSLWTTRSHQKTFSPLVAFLNRTNSTLVMGDFNKHHPFPDLLRPHSSDELAVSFCRSFEQAHGPLNYLGIYTHFHLEGPGRSLILDLAFASPLLHVLC